MEPLFPNVTVKLTGTDGNAFAILGNVERAMRKAGVAQKDIDRMKNDVFSRDQYALQTVMEWVNVE